MHIKKEINVFDETTHWIDDEIDLAELFRIIWFLISLLIFIMLSVPISVWVPPL